MKHEHAHHTTQILVAINKNRIPPPFRELSFCMCYKQLKTHAKYRIVDPICRAANFQDLLGEGDIKCEVQKLTSGVQAHLGSLCGVDFDLIFYFIQHIITNERHIGLIEDITIV